MLSIKDYAVAALRLAQYLSVPLSAAAITTAHISRGESSESLDYCDSAKSMLMEAAKAQNDEIYSIKLRLIGIESEANKKEANPFLDSWKSDIEDRIRSLEIKQLYRR